MADEKRTQLNININAELLKELKVQSTKEGKPLGEFITNILQKYTSPISKDVIKTIEEKFLVIEKRITKLEKITLSK